jgi:hypothetical protein
MHEFACDGEKRYLAFEEERKKGGDMIFSRVKRKEERISFTTK